MIRINLIGGAAARQPSEFSRFFSIPPEQRAALFGATVLMATAIGVAGWWWTLDSSRRGVESAIAQKEAALVRLQESARLVAAADARQKDLRERVGLIERLRDSQRAPVVLLETISASVPDGLWLLELKQESGTVRIEGQAVSLTAVTDFVARLQSSSQFVRTLDIVTTNMESIGEQSVVRFAISGDLRTSQSVSVPEKGGI